MYGLCFWRRKQGVFQYRGPSWKKRRFRSHKFWVRQDSRHRTVGLRHSEKTLNYFPDDLWWKISINEVTVTNWKCSLASLLAGFDPENVFNCYETALFFRALLNKSLTVKDETGGKYARMRFTILHCARASGEKERPLVIRKLHRPRCFGRLEISQLPIVWNANKYEWMTTEIFKECLTCLNDRIRAASRQVALILNNATFHCMIELSNVKLFALPPNSQPRLANR